MQGNNDNANLTNNDEIIIMLSDIINEIIITLSCKIY